MTNIKVCDVCGRAPAIRYFLSRNFTDRKGVRMVGAADLCDVCLSKTPFLPIQRREKKS